MTATASMALETVSSDSANSVGVFEHVKTLAHQWLQLDLICLTDAPALQPEIKATVCQ